MAKVVTFPAENPNAAGIDIGSQKIFVSTDGENVTVYETFTADFRQCIKDLKAAGIERAAMEATGVYWMELYNMLQEAGFEVCLVNPKEVKQVKGRKTDVKDCQWIQRVYSAGLVMESFVPAGKLMDMRLLVRQRLDFIAQGSEHVLKMQKALEQMNIKITEVLSQVHGASGIRIIKAIIAGERDPQKLLALCDPRIIKAKSEKMLKALEGNFNETRIFLLNTDYEMWKQTQDMITIVDKAIEGLLKKMVKENQAAGYAGRSAEQITEAGAEDKQHGRPEKKKSGTKQIRHHQPKVEGLHEGLEQLFGVELSSLSGINDYTALRLLGEIGTDMSRFPTCKRFVSWCGLAPLHNQSGKSSRRVKAGHGQRVGQILRECAQSLSASKTTAIGEFIRRIRARRGPKVAMKAGAKKLAEAIYHMLTKGKDYVEEGVIKYKEQLKEKEMRVLKKLALKHNMVLTDA